MRKVSRSVRRRCVYAGIIAQYEREKKFRERLTTQTVECETARAILKGG